MRPTPPTADITRLGTYVRLVPQADIGAGALAIGLVQNVAGLTPRAANFPEHEHSVPREGKDALGTLVLVWRHPGRLGLWLELFSIHHVASG